MMYCRYCGNLRAGIGTDRVSREDVVRFDNVNNALQHAIQTGEILRS
jgi:hypothetical protein